MATQDQPLVPLEGNAENAAMQQDPWLSRANLSSKLTSFVANFIGRIEHFLGASGLDRGPWVAVILASGIFTWFALLTSMGWVTAIAAGLLLALGSLAIWKGREDRTQLVAALVVIGLLFSAGIGLAWARSEVVGASALDRPISTRLEGRILERIEQPSQDRVRFVLASRNPVDGEAIKIRVNVPLEKDDAAFGEGALISVQARLMPPAAPMLPGGYDFGRAAWFAGYAATGSVQGEIELIEPAAQDTAIIAQWQRRISAHVREQLGGSAGAIAATLASGDRGAISAKDEEAMRDAGLTHLLSISGLHVSAVIGACYFVALKLLALWPWLTLRVRLPIMAAAIAAMGGLSYTLLTGAHVPTVRSCIAAILVLIALGLGRQALSLRLISVAAIVIMFLWPETLVGPSFQMSFSAVIAIVALHSAGPVREFLRPRQESWLSRFFRRGFMLLLTGFVIEFALMPIVLYHFHRAGIYGAFANVIAIPLVTFVSMPLIAIALLFDLVGAGAPFWWIAGKSLELLLGIAHFTSGQPGAVKLIPQMSGGTLSLFVAGGMWLALWRGRARLWGFLPALIGTILIISKPLPDLLISGDGRHVGIVGEDKRLLVLRETRSDYTRDNLMELSGVEGEPLALADWPGANCSRDFCVATLQRGGRDWHILMSRSNDHIEERALIAACERADIVVSDRWLPHYCEPKWLKADGRKLTVSGGLAINLSEQEITAVADSQGEHGWWRGRHEED